jgi:hypothetical protein
MNPEAFRALALLLPEALEGAHMGHPDFRVGGKIFATLWVDEDRAVLKLTPDQQDVMVECEPDVFEPIRARGDDGAGPTSASAMPTSRSCAAPSCRPGATWPRGGSSRRMSNANALIQAARRRQGCPSRSSVAGLRVSLSR